MKAPLLLLLGLLVAAPAHAQAVAPVVGTDLPARRAWLGVGWDPTFMVDLGASHEVLRVRACCRLGGDVAFRAPVVLLPGFDAWQLAVGATGLLRMAHGLGASLGLHPDVRVAHDTSGTKVAVGAALGARPGYYGERWTGALDLLWSTAIATHVAHSDAVKDLFRDRYPSPADERGPQDGWYAFSSHRFRLGVAGGFAPVTTVALHASAGLSYTPQVEGILTNPPIAPMPFYANLGGAYRW